MVILARARRDSCTSTPPDGHQEKAVFDTGATYCVSRFIGGGSHEFTPVVTGNGTVQIEIGTVDIKVFGKTVPNQVVLLRPKNAPDVDIIGMSTIQKVCKRVQINTDTGEVTCSEFR